LQLKLAAIGMIAAFGALNYLGARPGALAIVAFTFAKFAVLFVMVAVLFPRMDPALGEGAATPTLSGLSAATFMAVFAAQGFEVVPVTAGETRSAQRNVPIAIITSLLASSLLYVAVQSALSFSYRGLGTETDTPLADAALSVSPALGALVTFGGLVSTLGFVSGSALGTPRYLFAAAADGHLPRAWAKLHARWDSPHRTIILTSAVAILLVIPFDYRSLIGMSNVAVAVQYFATCLAVLAFRQRAGVTGISLARKAAPYLGGAVSIWIVTAASSEELWWAAAALLAGIVLKRVSASAAGAAD
jgi:amino acid transporter